MHKPVLVKEALEILNPRPGEFFIDGTAGSAGHAAAVLTKILPEGSFLAVDWDAQSLSKAREKIISEFGQDKKLDRKLKIYFAQGNYADLPEILKNNNLPEADGLLIDLGFSSEQLEGSGRGFSFLKDEPLDMRYHAGAKGEEIIITAAEVVNSFSEKDLADILWKYGEERYSRKIAKKITETRKRKKILTTFDLARVIREAVPKHYERGRIHPATRVFQALRIFVNRELDNLEMLLKNLPRIIKPGGRAAIISFHSLEDRLVKNYFRQMAKDNQVEILTKKPITAGEDERKENPRSRSAKLRAIKLNTQSSKL